MKLLGSNSFFVILHLFEAQVKIPTTSGLVIAQASPLMVCEGRVCSLMPMKVDIMILKGFSSGPNSYFSLSLSMSLVVCLSICKSSVFVILSLSFSLIHSLTVVLYLSFYFSPSFYIILSLSFSFYYSISLSPSLHIIPLPRFVSTFPSLPHPLTLVSRVGLEDILSCCWQMWVMVLHEK